MSRSLDISRLLRRRRDAVARLRGAPAEPPRADPRAIGRGQLHERRDRLARQLAELQWDLGGLAYEMAIRDHFRVDVLVRVAAELQTVDVELAEVERLLHLDEAGAAGTCASCAAPHARGAGFCWRCGTALLVTTGPAASGQGGAAEATLNGASSVPDPGPSIQP